MKKLGQLWFGFCLIFCWNPLFADAALLKEKKTQQFMNQMVQQYHFNRTELASVLRQAQYQPQIIESMEKPYEKKTWDVYRSIFLTPERLKAGLEFWKNNRQTLAQAEKQYGVPAPVIVAIIGVETLYGKHQGQYRVLDALTTLAFYYPKRSDFFTKELKEYLLLCREHAVSPTEYKGSYAGAMGKPQFMPSSYRFYAVDSTGKGHANLMQDDQDVIGSVANYFHRHGWKMHELVAEPVNLQGTRYKTLQMNAKHADYEYLRLVKAGIKPLGHPSHRPNKAGLIELTTNSGQAYWMAYPNFYVITRYNTSPQYALVVHLLAMQLQNLWVNLQGNQSGA